MFCIWSRAKFNRIDVLKLFCLRLHFLDSINSLLLVHGPLARKIAELVFTVTCFKWLTEDLLKNDSPSKVRFSTSTASKTARSRNAWTKVLKQKITFFTFSRTPRQKSPLLSCISLSTHYGHHVARLRCSRRAFALTNNTARHDNHEKINSWVSICFRYKYGAPLGGPWGRRSSGIKQIDSMLPCVCSVIDHRRR